MAAARRVWGTGASAKPGPELGWGRAWVRVPAKAAAEGVAEEAEEQEVSRQLKHRRIEQKSREQPAATAQWRPGLARTRPGSAVMAGGADGDYGICSLGPLGLWRR